MPADQLQCGTRGKRFELGGGQGDLDRAAAPELDGKAAIGLDVGDEIVVLGQAADSKVEQRRRLIELATGRKHPRSRRAGLRTDLFLGIEQ